MTKSVAIITARGGSKRIPGKNIRDFLGKPIIAYSIAAALNSGCFEEVMVSTDDTKIAGIAERYGAKIPFYRSSDNSDDSATTSDVLIEVLHDYKKLGRNFTYACCLYPTAPFVTGPKLKHGYMQLIKFDADSVFPVTRFSYPIQRALKIENNRLVMFWPENMDVRSQDFQPAYHDAGQFYWFNVGRFLKTKTLFTDNSLPHLTSEIEVQDIDNEVDWKLAELKYQLFKREKI